MKSKDTCYICGGSPGARGAESCSGHYDLIHHLKPFVNVSNQSRVNVGIALANALEKSNGER